MARTTSATVYYQIKEEGVLSERRLQTYEVLYHNGPLTAMELCEIAGVPGLWKRLSELKEMGLAKEVNEKVCSVTGRTVLAWDVTDQAPTKLTKRQRLEKEKANLIAKLRKVMAVLTTMENQNDPT